MNPAGDGYGREGKTDARDALLIADQTRIRRRLKPMRSTDEATIELKLLTSRRTDLVRERTPINHLRSTSTGMFPTLERALVRSALGASAVRRSSSRRRSTPPNTSTPQYPANRSSPSSCGSSRATRRC
ncbi:transposase [Streptomyces virginiae]|uniref:IS110 family transposase n=1 Tax=Streptomyces TaxID=1883 RepID=UPI00131C097C|nr:transposase [Streptomyces sp. XY533]